MAKPDMYMVRQIGLPVEYGALTENTAKGYISGDKGYEILPGFAIDDETREALRDAIACLRLSKDLARKHTNAEFTTVDRHIAALERLTGGGE